MAKGRRGSAKTGFIEGRKEDYIFNGKGRFEGRLQRVLGIIKVESRGVK